MWQFDLHFITGLMFGIEFPAAKEIQEDLKFTMVVDLGILRIALLIWEPDGD